MAMIYQKSGQLFDAVIGGIEAGLSEQLPWMTNVFGRCERLVKMVDGVRRYSPNWYKGGDEYMLLTPDQGLGNFCFFVMDEPEDVEWNVGERSRLSCGFSLIVWLDMRTVEDEDTRDTEAVKADILRVLNGGIRVRHGGFEINEIYTRAENIYQGFTLDEVDNQFLMSPFCGFRFHGKLKVFDVCV